MAKLTFLSTGVLVTSLFACAAGDMSQATSGRRGGPSSPTAPTMDTSGGAGSGATLMGDNATWTPPAVVDTVLPDAGCVEGERCYAGASPDEDNCGTVELKAKVETVQHPGNVLLVFDTSFSMTMDWNGMARWQQAAPAIINALTPLQDMITVGSVFFPRNEPGGGGLPGLGGFPRPGPGGLVCGVTPITSADQITFKPGREFLTAFTTPVNGVLPYAPVNLGATPLKEALMQAQTAITSSTLTGLTSVVIITDGDPNCEWLPDGEQITQQIVTDWAAMGIRTYVVGLPGTTGAGDAVLKNLAVAGGTMTYITPADSATLEMKLREIATETVKRGFETCGFDLDPPAEVPDKLLMIAEEAGMRQNVPHMAGPNAGWTISPDGKRVEITGALCDDATTGRFDSITFEFGCPDIPPPPTLPPVI
jgi:hypothetical protein